jgi:hypothetical protein
VTILALAAAGESSQAVDLARSARDKLAARGKQPGRVLQAAQDTVLRLALAIPDSPSPRGSAVFGQRPHRYNAPADIPQRWPRLQRHATSYCT